MTIMPIATPTAPPTATSTPSSDDGSVFADVMEHHLGGSGLSREAANAVLDEAASPSVAPSDGLAAVVARLVGTAGTRSPGTGSLGAGSSGTGSVGTGGPVEAAVGDEPDMWATTDGDAAAVPPAVVEAQAAPRGEATAVVAGAATAVGKGTSVAGAGADAGTVNAPEETAVADGVRAVGSGTGSRSGTVDPVGAAPLQGDGAGRAGAATTSTAPNGRSLTAEAANASVTSGPVEPETGDHAASTGMAAETNGQSDDTRPSIPGGDRAVLAGAGGSAGVVGVSASTAASGPPIEKPADGVRGTAVTDQVFDHVTRLVSRGDGTHRLMLKLHPADLGEVQVVLTMKNGTVDVTLSAGAAAREVLRDGSPQLRALLELTGATTGQVVVRDLGGGVATTVSQQQPNGFGADSQREPADAGTEAKGDSSGDSSGGRGEPQVPGGRGNTEVRDGAGAGARRTSAHDAAPAAPDFVGSVRVDLNL